METTLIDPGHRRCSKWYSAAAAERQGGHFVVIAPGTSLPSGHAMVLRVLDGDSIMTRSAFPVDAPHVRMRYRNFDTRSASSKMSLALSAAAVPVGSPL